MYKLKKLKIVCILSGICIIAASGINYSYSNAGYIQEQQIHSLKTERKQKKYKYKQDKKKVNPFSSIKADVKSLDIVVKPSGDKDFYISYNLYCANNSNPVSYNIKNNVLEIKESELEWLAVYVKGTGSGINKKLKNYKNIIYVYVPLGVSINNCDLDIKDGDLDFSKVSLKGGNIISKDGDIDFNNSVLSDNLSIKTTNGDIYGHGTDINGILDIKSINGDIYIYKPDVAGTLNVITDNGDLYTSKANIKGKLEINTHNGDVDAGSLGISGETKIKADSGDVDITINSRCLDSLNINIFTKDGDMSVKKLYKDKGSKKRTREGYQYKKTGSGKAVLDVYTDCGDISLN